MDTELEKIRRLVGSCLVNTGARVYFFGSRSRGEGRFGSDVDIAIDVLPEYSLQIGMIREVLEESDVIYRCDVLCLADASQPVRARIIAEGVEWTY